MYVVVVGMGQVGRHVVRTLEIEKHDVVAIDHDPAVIQQISEHHDIFALTGYGARMSVLEQADAARADLFVAVTNHDEVNLIAALAAKQMGAKRSIARVQGTEWSGRGAGTGIEYGLLGIDVVFNPRVLLAQEFAKIAQSHGAIEVIDIADNRIEVVQLELGEQHRVLGRSLSKLALPRHVLVGAIVRDGQLFVPGGSDVLISGDRVYLLGLPEHMSEAEKLFTRQKEARRVCIVGGGVVGEALARNLQSTRTGILLIEEDEERARALAAKLPEVVVVRGDGTDLGLLEEEQVGTYDLVVAVTNEDEVNLMAALLARRVGAARVGTLVHRPDYADIYRQLDVDVVLSPRLVASDHILRFCRQSEVQSLTMLEEGRAEILEIRAHVGSRIVKAPLHSVRTPRGSLIGAVLKGGRVIIPRGDDIVEPGDTVVVLTTPAARAAVTHLFQPRLF